MNRLLEDAAQRASRYLGIAIRSAGSARPRSRAPPRGARLRSAGRGTPWRRRAQITRRARGSRDHGDGRPAFFGFVIGGALPVTVAANWLATAWDQNAGLYDVTPAQPPRGGRAALAHGPARSAGRARRRIRHRRHDGELHRARRGASRLARSASAGMSKQTACSARRRSPSSSARKLTPRCSRRWAARPRPQPRHRVPVDDQGRMRADALPPLHGPDDRLPAGRQREHRRLRSAREICRRARRTERGCTSTARSGSGRRARRARRVWRPA